MSKFFYTCCLCLVMKGAFSCSCTLFTDFKSKEDLKGYDFISLVSIKELAPLDTVNKFMHLRTNGNIKIEVIELFKGERIDLLIDENFSNDCAFSLQVGEQWIFFGRTYNGKTTVSKCSYSVNYQHQDGFRDWKFFTGIKQLDVLRNIYGHNLIQNVTIEFYPSGKPEVKQAFKNGKLNGRRWIYYPNGQLYVTEKFKKGTRVGFRNIYTLLGQLEREVTYRNGLIKQTIAYQDTLEDAWYLNFQVKHHTDALFGDSNHDVAYFIKILDSLRNLRHWEKQISNIYNYSSDGRIYTNRSYNYKGDIRTKGFLDWNKQLSEEYHYYENGNIQYCVKLDQKANQQIEFDYDKNGKRRDFLKKCEACKFYFNKTLPVALPEPVYIQ